MHRDGNDVEFTEAIWASCYAGFSSFPGPCSLRLDYILSLLHFRFVERSPLHFYLDANAPNYVFNEEVIRGIPRRCDVFPTFEFPKHFDEEGCLSDHAPYPAQSEIARTVHG